MSPILFPARSDYLGLIEEAELTMSNAVIAVGRLARENISALGATFTRFYPVDETPCFGELLNAIDEADREIRRSRLGARSNPPRSQAQMVKRVSTFHPILPLKFQRF